MSKSYSFYSPANVCDKLPVLNKTRIYQMPKNKVVKLEKAVHLGHARIVGVDNKGKVWVSSTRSSGRYPLIPYLSWHMDVLEGLHKIGVLPKAELSLINDLFEKYKKKKDHIESAEYALGQLLKVGIKPTKGQLLAVDKMKADVEDFIGELCASVSDPVADEVVR